MRAYISTRGLPGGQGRARVAALVARKPVLVTVTRPSGSGLSAPKTWPVVATFLARIDDGRPLPATRNDAFVLVPTGLLLTALRDNDAVDGTSGSPVDIRQDDRVTANGVTYTVTGVQALASHVEAALAVR
jgi:hypothetical protein